MSWSRAVAFPEVLEGGQGSAGNQNLPVLRLLIFGGRGSESTLALLKRRRLGQLAIISVVVILLRAAVGFLLEEDAPEPGP